MNGAFRLLPVSIALSVLSVWMLVAGMNGSAAIESEFTRAEQLVADGQGVQLAVESSGSEVYRGGRRTLPQSCYTFEYAVADETFQFTEKRMCASYWRWGVDAEIVYVKADPSAFSWVRSDVTEQMLDGPRETTVLGFATGGVALAVSLAAVVMWFVTRRKDESPLAGANGD